ncbi:MAG: hypothetical protein LLG45_01685, partial [Actinomycetia bacterium]|nr:hypothetical protein [Actinomycetes bacterium]
EAEVEDVNSTGTQLKVEAPAGTDGTVVDVRVITDMGTSPNTQADDYAYAVPHLTALIPSEGDESGGNKMLIIGTGFTANAKVYFDDVSVPSGDVVVNGPNQFRNTRWSM